MGTENRSRIVKLFNNLVVLLKNQQEQLETLVEERKFLEDRIKLQHERWASDVRLCEDHVSQMKDALTEKEMTCLLLAAKSDLKLGFKQREASLHKFKLEHAEDELADFRSCFDLLSEILDKNSKESDYHKEVTRNSDAKSSGYKRLDNEVKRLKSEYEKLASEKNSEISALLKEKSFVWNQYNVLESSINDKLKSKQSEVDLTNAKIAKVLASMEMLESANEEKEEMIGRLKATLAEVETDRDKCKEDITRLSLEFESFRKSRSAQVTPSIKQCNTGAKSSNLVVKSNGRNGSNFAVKKEPSTAKAATAPLKDAEKGSKGLKRKEVEVITALETPKLFSAAFKIPKLKSLSTPAS